LEENMLNSTIERFWKFLLQIFGKAFFSGFDTLFSKFMFNINDIRIRVLQLIIGHHPWYIRVQLFRM